MLWFYQVDHIGFHAIMNYEQGVENAENRLFK